MSQISQLTSSDPRSAWDKVSRRQCWAGARKLGLEFRDSASHTDMVNLFVNKGIQPEQVVNFVPVSVPTENGQEKTVMYPEEHERKFDEHKEHRRMEEFERRIQEGVEKEEKRLSAEKDQMAKEKDSEISGLKDEVSELKVMLEKLLEAQKPKPKETDPLKMKYMAQKKWLKDRGVELNKGDDADHLVKVALLNEAKSDG